jgi:hypothetical protein
MSVASDKKRVMITLKRSDIERLEAEITAIKRAGQKVTLSQYIQDAIYCKWQADSAGFTGNGSG